MPNSRLTLACLFCLLVLSACSIDINQTASPTPTALAGTPTPAPALQNTPAGPSLPAFSVPLTWGDLKLTGKLVYTASGQDGNTPYMRIQMLDLATGKGATVFQAPSNGFIYFASVSPDGKALIMAYSPPPGTDLSGHQELYSLPLDGSAPPQLLFMPPTPNDEYFQPEWSADGKYLYFTHVNFQAPPTMPKQHYPIYEVERMAYPAGQPQKLADQAYWPRLSGDAAHLAYVSLDPLTGKNNLYVANADGSNPQNLSQASQGMSDIIDAPIFSADNGSILFSAVVQQQSAAPGWFERLLGVSVASAHTVPSDWWSIPLSGGTPAQLTHINAVGLFASYSPDRQYLASYSGAGIFVMKPDGSQSTMLVTDVGGQPGTVSWIP